MTDTGTEALTPVPVVGTVSLDNEILDRGFRTSPQAAAFGAWMTYTLAATAAAQPILPFDDKRSRALIIVSGTGPIYVGTQAQCQANPPVGGLLPSSSGGAAVYEVRNQQSLWLAPDGSHTATVTVLVERWGDH
jgi:hypothetical protein